MIPPVPETPRQMTLDDWLNAIEGSLRCDSSAPVQHLRAEIHKVLRTAQAEAAERGFREGWERCALGSWREPSKAWAASRLKAELEQQP